MGCAWAPRDPTSTLDGFKATLVRANAIAFSTEGAAGTYKDLLARPGLSEALRAKLKPLPDENLAHALPDGGANLVIGAIPYVPQFGAELLGPLPAEVQIRIGFAAARGSSATEVQAAEALLAYLHTPEAVAVLKAKGFEPK